MQDFGWVSRELEMKNANNDLHKHNTELFPKHMALSHQLRDL